MRKRPRPSSMMLAGLRSRWSSPQSWAAARRAQYSVRGFKSFVAGQSADAAQQGSEVLAIDVLHGEEMLAVHLADVVDATNIGMRDLAGVAHFSMKSGESRGIFLERGGKKLQRYDIAEF